MAGTHTVPDGRWSRDQGVRRDQRGKRLAIAAQAASIAGGIEIGVGEPPIIG